MKGTIAISVLVIASICGVLLTISTFEAHKNSQRNAKYEAVAEGFRRELMAGTTRREVAQYLRSRNVQFHEVSSYSRPTVIWSYETKIENYETLSFPCSRWTAYGVFDFHS